MPVYLVVRVPSSVYPDTSNVNAEPLLSFSHPAYRVRSPLVLAPTESILFFSSGSLYQPVNTMPSMVAGSNPNSSPASYMVGLDGSLVPP